MNYDNPKASLRLRWERVPPAIASVASVQTVRAYKEWLKKAEKVLAQREPDRMEILSLCTQYDSWK